MEEFGNGRATNLNMNRGFMSIQGQTSNYTTNVGVDKENEERIMKEIQD